MNPAVGVTVAAFEAWNIQYATLTDKAAKDFSTIPGLAESWKGSDGRQDLDLQAAAEPQVVRRQAAHVRGHRLHDQPLARGGVAQLHAPSSPTSRPRRRSPRPSWSRRRSPTRSCRRWTPTSSRSTSSRSTTPRRSRSRTARTASARARTRWRSSRRASSRASRPTRTTGGGKPPLDAVVIRNFNNADAMVAALRSGEIDAAHDVPGRRLRPAGGSTPDIEVVEGNQGAFNEFAINGGDGLKKGHPALSDPLVRRAIAHAIDKQTIVERIYDGHATPAHTISPSANPTWMPKIPDEQQLRLRPGQGQGRSSTRRGYEDTDGDGVREMPGGGQPLRLRYAVRSETPDAAADRRVHHGLAEGHRDRHDAEGLRRRPAHRGDRQGRLRPVRVGLDPVRRPRHDALLLHLRPGQPGSRGPDELLQRREPLRPGVRQALRAAEGRARSRTSGSRSCTRCSRGSTPRGVYNVLYTYPDLQAYRTDRFEGFVRQPEDTGPVLFTNTHADLRDAQAGLGDVRTAVAASGRRRRRRRRRRGRDHRRRRRGRAGGRPACCGLVMRRRIGRRARVSPRYRRREGAGVARDPGVRGGVQLLPVPGRRRATRSRTCSAAAT